MRISYNWLKTYFDTLPEPEEVKLAFEQHAFEVEEINKTTSDTIFELDILPNRAGDCLSYRGIAEELSAILNLPLKSVTQSDLKVAEQLLAPLVTVETNLCRRYLGRLVQDIKIEPSPLWLKTKIEIMGGRSINNLVDLTNLVLFEIGQPLHIFDADKVEGGIIVRLAKTNETMTTLDNKELKLTTEDIVIADAKKVLALAGVKGGKSAEVDNSTTNIIIESANFDPATTRKGGNRHDLRTDAVKRFENNLTPDLAEVGLKNLSNYILELLPDANFSKWTDVYLEPLQAQAIEISFAYINERLGVVIGSQSVIDILERLRFEVSAFPTHLLVTPPNNRLDIKERPDVVEEVGRLFGYDKIKDVLPPKILESKPDVIFTLIQKIKQILLENGFSEIYGYTFSSSGEVEVAKPLSEAYPYLRSNLSLGLIDKIKFNLKHDLFESDPVAIFDIGTIFKSDEEIMTIAFGVGYTKNKYYKNDKLVPTILEIFKKEFKLELQKFVTTEETITVVEFPVTEILDHIKVVNDYDLTKFRTSDKTYQPISVYPRIIRDVAVLVPLTVKPEMISDLIKTEAGLWFKLEPILFDEFIKEEDQQTSFAFRLIFQADDRTLTDDEVNEVMTKIYDILTKQGYIVR